MTLFVVRYDTAAFYVNQVFVVDVNRLRRLIVATPVVTSRQVVTAASHKVEQQTRKVRRSDETADAPLTFPLGDELPPPGLHVCAQVLHHAVDAVVEGQAAGLGLDGLPADGALIPPLAPLPDAVVAEAMCTAQGDRLPRKRVQEVAQRKTTPPPPPRPPPFGRIRTKSKRTQGPTSMKSSEQMMH